MAIRRFTRSWLSAIGLLAGTLAVASCDGLLGPSRGAEIYVLTSIGGLPADPELNILAMCMPEYAAQGAALYMLADSLVLNADGSGRKVSHQRSRAADYQVTRDSIRVFYTDLNEPMRHFRMGPIVVVIRDSVREEWRVTPDGALEAGGWCGPWRFEKVSPAAP